MDAAAFFVGCISVIAILRKRGKARIDRESTKQASKTNRGSIKCQKHRIFEEVTSTILKKAIAFKGTYSKVGPRQPQVRLVNKELMTKGSRDKLVYHLAFSFVGDWPSYQAGASLAVWPKNDPQIVDELLDLLAIRRDQLVLEEGSTLCTVKSWLVNHADLFGAAPRSFYEKLALHAESRYERLKLAHTGTDDKLEYKVRRKEGTSAIDILRQYKSIKIRAAQLLEIIPRNKHRLYSISSSSLVSPSEVHLLVSVVRWTTPTGRLRFGQCSTYLASLDVGDAIRAEVRKSTMKLPRDPSRPIVMAGLGTGLAPFRAFALERMFLRQQGEKVGPTALYFGARHRASEYLYQKDIERLAEDGTITHLRLAFSRDQESKIYIQHIMDKEGTVLRQLICDQVGSFYLCGPTWPVPDVKKALENSLVPETTISKLKAQERYQLEVY